MKILAISYLFPNNEYPDQGIFVYNRLKAISNFCKVIVINPVPWFPGHTLFRRYKNYNQIPEKEIIGGMDVYHPKFFIIPGYFKFIDLFSFAFAVHGVLKGELKNYKFDLIDLHWTYPDILSGVISAKYFKKKFLVTVRGKEALNMFAREDGGYRSEKSLRNLLLMHFFHKANRVITLSDELKNICIQSGIDKTKIITIRNGVDTNLFYYMKKDTCKEILNLPTDKKIILSIGTINLRKGFDRIIRALKEMDNKDIIAYFIGASGADGDYSIELNNLVKRLDMEDRVRFVGHVSNKNLILWYNAADIFCLASRGEGSPNVLTEALACGCPSVATAVGSVNEIIHKELGCIVPNNETDLIIGLNKALCTKYDRKKNAEYMKSYNWDWCAKKVIAEYKKTLGNPFKKLL